MVFMSDHHTFLLLAIMDYDCENIILPFANKHPLTCFVRRNLFMKLPR